MIGALQTHKKLLELKNESCEAKMLVIDLNPSGYQVCFFTKEFEIVLIGELVFRETAKNEDELLNYLEQLTEEFGLTKTKLEQIHINWPGKKFTLVPSAYYLPEKAKEYLEFTVGSAGEEKIFVNDVKNDIKLLFSISAELKNFLDKTFPNHDLKHSGACMINLFFNHFQLKKADVFLNITDTQMELLVKKEKQLLLYNMFSIKSNEDILYYLLFSVEQFGLDPATLHLAISANRETSDELFMTLKKYIRHIQFVTTDKIIKRKEVFETLPHHYYFSLLNRPLCE